MEVVPQEGDPMSEAPNLQDYMLPVLKLFEDGKEHSSKEIPAHLEAGFTLLQADTPNLDKPEPKRYP